MLLKSFKSWLVAIKTRLIRKMYQLKPTDVLVVVELRNYHYTVSDNTIKAHATSSCEIYHNKNSEVSDVCHLESQLTLTHLFVEEMLDDIQASAISTE